MTNNEAYELTQKRRQSDEFQAAWRGMMGLVDRLIAAAAKSGLSNVSTRVTPALQYAIVEDLRARGFAVYCEEDGGVAISWHNLNPSPDGIPC